MVGGLRRWRHDLLVLITVGGVMQMLSSALRDDTYNAKLFSAAWGGPPTGLMRRWHAVDTALLKTIGPEPQNVLADFADTQPRNDLDPNARGFLLTRATYLLWPRRIYLCDTDVPLVNGDSILAARWPTDSAWSAAHHVGRRIHIGLGPAETDVVMRAEAPTLP